MKIDGNKPAQLRKKAALSQDTLAEDICSSSLISKIERGLADSSSKYPNLAHNLARRFEVPVDDLLVEEESSPEVAPTAEPVSQEAVEAPTQEAGFDLDAPQSLKEMIKSSVQHFRPKRLAQLGRNERNAWLFINGFVHKTDHILAGFREREENYDPLMIVWMEQGMRLIAKAMALRLAQCEEKTVKQLVRESYLLDVALAHRNRADAQRVYNKFYEEDRALRRQAVEERGGDPISDLAEIALLSQCQNCDGSKRSHGCKTFDALRALNIPEWEIDHPACPYAGSGVVDLADTA